MPRTVVVLCVGDEPTIQYLRRLLLSATGYTIIIAATFDSALRMFSFNPVDLVISGNSLGQRSGVELCWEMKWLKPEVPLVLFTGLNEPPRATEPIDLVLALNMTPPAFLKAIAELVAKKPVSHPSPN